ncbi:Cilia- And Flagella-Associated Protein 54 [Manis pentadactyla]|nr:Cilia- And Flagella-Associated Protein 54 [Manis pentadactyla]
MELCFQPPLSICYSRLVAFASFKKANLSRHLETSGRTHCSDFGASVMTVHISVKKYQFAYGANAKTDLYLDNQNCGQIDTREINQSSKPAVIVPPVGWLNDLYPEEMLRTNQNAQGDRSREHSKVSSNRVNSKSLRRNQPCCEWSTVL